MNIIYVEFDKSLNECVTSKSHLLRNSDYLCMIFVSQAISGVFSGFTKLYYPKAGLRLAIKTVKVEMRKSVQLFLHSYGKRASARFS